MKHSTQYFLVTSALAFALACGDDPVVELDGGSFDAGLNDAATGDAGLDASSLEEPCDAPRQFCGGECVDLTSSSEHCGRCDNACTGGLFCSEGTCAAECSDDLTACGTECVDTETSANHCGACATDGGDVCRADQSCVAGSCACTEGRVECGEGCVNTDTSNAHCGGCDQPCDGTCSEGACIPAAETACDNDTDDDGDDLVDCADPDCSGATRACTCDDGVTESTQTCDSGDWSECTGCAPPAECSDTDPCDDYGFTCVSSVCELDRTSLWDLRIEAATVTALDYNGNDWDNNYWFDPRPDVYVRTRFVNNTGPRGNLVIRNGESESTTTVENATTRPTWSGTDGDTLTDISPDVFDTFDLELTIFDQDGIAWETMCQFRYARSLPTVDTDLLFDGAPHTLVCPRDDDEEWNESTVTIRFLETTSGT